MPLNPGFAIQPRSSSGPLIKQIIIRSPHHNPLLPSQRYYTSQAPRLFSTTSSQRQPSSPQYKKSNRPNAVIALFALATAAVAATVYFRPGQQTLGVQRNMSSKLVPANPSEVMVIRDVTPNVVTFSVPFSRFGKIPIGGRGTLVRLTSGNLAIFSPVALTPEAKAKVASLANGDGRLEYIIATDAEHHIFMSEWAREYPGAKLIGPEGLPEKRAKTASSGSDPRIGPEPFTTVFSASKDKPKLTTSISPEFDTDFQYEYVDAHPNKELVFFFKPDRVLIEADLMFNLPAKEQYSRVPNGQLKPPGGVLGRIFESLSSTEGEAKGIKRFLWHGLSRGDRMGFNQSVRRIQAWDFTTIVPCHGDTVVGNGKEVFNKVFAWHLEGKE